MLWKDARFAKTEAPVSINVVKWDDERRSKN